MEIREKKYNPLPGAGAIFLFCERKGIEFSDFLERVTKYDFEKMPNSLIDDLAEFVLCCIERGGEKPLCDKYDVVDWLVAGNFEEVIDLFKKSIGPSKNSEALPNREG